MKNIQTASRPFRFRGMGKIRLGLLFIAFATFISFAMLLVISAVSSPFAHASARMVPIPPKRPDVMSASPAYIRQLMARSSTVDVYSEDDLPLEDSHQNYDLEYSEEKIAAIHSIDPKYLPQSEDDEYHEYDSGYLSEISEAGVPVPGRKPSYGNSSIVQRVEDFSNHVSSVELAFIEPEVGGRYSDASGPNDYYTEAAASGAVRQPISTPSQKGNEKALVSFTLDSKQILLDPNLKTFLLDHALKQFKSDPDLRLEIHAYASTESGQEFSDVRRSLARALEVRSFLLEQNIDPSRLKITPMGQDSDNTTDDRIDLLFIVSK